MVFQLADYCSRNQIINRPTFLGGCMNRLKKSVLAVVVGAGIILYCSHSVWAQAGGHASVGLGHGEEGYLHLEEMIKHLEFGLKMPDANSDLKAHGGVALQHAREALKHYNEALKHANESLGRSARNPMMDGSGGGHSGNEGSHSHDEKKNNDLTEKEITTYKLGLEHDLSAIHDAKDEEIAHLKSEIKNLKTKVEIETIRAEIYNLKMLAQQK